MIAWREEPISRRHDCESFDCGHPGLNDYLRRYARQNHTRGSTKTFVAEHPDTPSQVLGYYSVCPSELEFELAPEEITRRLARYPVSGFRLARLAVASELQGQGLGSELFAAAAERILSVATKAGGVILLIDAKDERAATWYTRFGAQALADSPLSLVIPLQTLARAASASRTI